MREACGRRGVPLEEMLRELEAEEAAESGAEGGDVEALAPVDLIRHIVGRHHRYLRDELPRLQMMARRVAHVHGEHTPSLLQVHLVMDALAEELEAHMAKEEQVLFPAIEAMADGRSEPLQLDGPIICMMQDHADATHSLERLAELTNAFSPPPDACNTYRALFGGLADLNTDLRRHIHLENEVLFPAARDLMAGRAVGEPR